VIGSKPRQRGRPPQERRDASSWKKVYAAANKAAAKKAAAKAPKPARKRA